MSEANISRTSWNKGLTKKTDERVAKYSNTLVGHNVSDKTREKMRLCKIGKISPRKGISHTPEAREKMSVDRKGSIPWNKGMSGEEYLQYFPNGMGHGEIMGSDNSNWKGGKTPLNNKIRQCVKYKKWRKAVFSRDNYTCQDCFLPGGELNAHHKQRFCTIINNNNIKTLKEAMECRELWNINNGKTLCIQCHNLTKLKGGENNGNNNRSY